MHRPASIAHARDGDCVSVSSLPCGPPPLTPSVMLRKLSSILPLLLLGCAHPQTVTRPDMDQLKARWHEPKVSLWYYTGSKDGYHYFHHDDLGHDKKDFRIAATELSWTNAFPLTSHRNSWRPLDWGVYERH